jgi:hypothetical protein
MRRRADNIETVLRLRERIVPCLGKALGNVSKAGIVIAPDQFGPWLTCLVAFAAGVALSRWRLRARPIAESAVQPAIPSFKDALPSFTRELDRVRRFDRPLSLVVIKLEEDCATEESLEVHSWNGDSPGEGGEAIFRAARNIMFWNLGHVLNDLVRASDVAACDLSNRRYLLLLPESDEESAVFAATRIEERVLQTIGARIRNGVAEFRSDGFTIGDLLAVAAAKCDGTAAVPQALPRPALSLHIARDAEAQS